MYPNSIPQDYMVTSTDIITSLSKMLDPLGYNVSASDDLVSKKVYVSRYDHLDETEPIAFCITTAVSYKRMLELNRKNSDAERWNRSHRNPVGYYVYLIGCEKSLVRYDYESGLFCFKELHDHDRPKGHNVVTLRFYLPAVDGAARVLRRLIEAAYSKFYDFETDLESPDFNALYRSRHDELSRLRGIKAANDAKKRLEEATRAAIKAGFDPKSIDNMVNTVHVEEVIDS